MNGTKKIVILGATGSIGTSALKVIAAHPDHLELVGISAHRQGQALATIAEKFRVPRAVLSDEEAYRESVKESWFPSFTEVEAGAEALEILAACEEADLILVALVGTSGLRPVLRAIEAGKTIALANKEVLVMAGEWVMQLAHQAGIQMLPADSEHNAIFQCLHADLSRLQDVEKVLLTASGGPFRQMEADAMAQVTPEQALDHPNWDMGPKVTLDSATMANKGLELIEARWLFDLPVHQLDVVVHPQSIVHSMVQFRDGSILAQLSPPCMTFSLQYCLLFPERAPGVEAPLDFQKAFSLDFQAPDLRRFPCLALARDSLAQGNSAPCIFNAANEIAGEAFLQGKIQFMDIPRIIDKTLEKASIIPLQSLDAVFETDREARSLAKNFVT